MVEMHAVESSQIAKIGWEKETLFVIFTGGGAEYRYADVPEDVFTRLMSKDEAHSPGRVFNELVKGQYSHTKHEITPPPDSMSGVRWTPKETKA